MNFGACHAWTRRPCKIVDAQSTYRLQLDGNDAGRRSFAIIRQPEWPARTQIEIPAFSCTQSCDDQYLGLAIRKRLVEIRELGPISGVDATVVSN